ncbi:DUF4372 domain-containing protein [Sinomicrobium sp. M5D2P9]
MNTGKYVFSLLITLLLRRVFDRIVTKHNSNKYIRYFMDCVYHYFYAFPYHRLYVI